MDREVMISYDMMLLAKLLMLPRLCEQEQLELTDVSAGNCRIFIPRGLARAST
jgi:hypothetical protein